jgi:CheY-like chemotaxis protein
LSTTSAEACLQPFGARVVSAGSASQAKQMISGNIPDVVICDLALPDHDGLEFIRWLRTRRPEHGGIVPAIAVTFSYERFGVRETPRRFRHVRPQANRSHGHRPSREPARQAAAGAVVMTGPPVRRRWAIGTQRHPECLAA